MKKRSITIAVIFTLLCYSALYAQPNMQIAWQRTMGGDKGESMNTMTKTSDGGYILGGDSNSGTSGEKKDSSRGSSDLWIVKVNDTGTIQWQKTIGGSGVDKLKSIKSTNDGGYILGGHSRSGISGEKTDSCRGQYDYWIVKINGSGVIQWQKTYGGENNDQLSSVIQTKDGGYLVGGYSNSGITGEKTDLSRSLYGGSNYWVLKLDTLGRIQWQKTIGGNDEDRLYDLIQTTDGGYLLGGQSTSDIWGEKTESLMGGSDYWIVKLSAGGTIEWEKTIGGDNLDALNSVKQTTDGGYILGGQSFSSRSGAKTDTNRGSSDYWIVKVDSKGKVLWDKTYGGDDYDWCTEVIVTTDSGLLLHGNSRSAQGGDKTEMGFGNADYWVIKTNDSGRIEWQKTLGGNGIDQPFQSGGLAIETAKGQYLIGGYSFSGVSGNKTDSNRGVNGDFWIVKLHETCPDTTYIKGFVCSGAGYPLPWDTTVYAGGTYLHNYPPIIEGSKCDSVVFIMLTALVDTTVSLIDRTLTAQDSAATYQWIDCTTGLAIPGATSVSYTASGRMGRYAVIVTANGCSDTSNCYDLGRTGIYDSELSSFIAIYPNPAKTEVTIENKSSARLQQISLVNILGAEVYKANVTNSGLNNINIGHLSSGIYMLRLQTDRGVVTHKLEILTQVA